jgi:chorismate synthase
LLNRRTGNSIGGVVEVVARNVPAGLGSPVFDKLEAELAKACMSLPASKGFEVSGIVKSEINRFM